MKLNLLKKITLNPFIVLLVFLNVFLLFKLFDLDIHEINVPFTVENYPEIIELKDKNWNFQETAKFFKDLSVKKGGEYGYHVLTVALNNGFVAPNIDAHLLGHTVGDILYKQEGIDGIQVCTDDIRNACSHSIVVGYLLDYGESSLPKAVKTCEKAPGGKGAYTMCIHGLGHGVLAYAGYDMKKAALLCSKTGTKDFNNQEVGQCIGGVTMEMMAGIHDREVWSKQAPNYLKKSEPLAPCNMGFLPKGTTSFCYAYLTPHLFELAGAVLAHPDPIYFGKAMSYCGAIPQGDPDRTRCFGSFGKEYVVLANNRNVQSVTQMTDMQLQLVYNWCSLGGEEALHPCLGSALESLYWGGENDPEVSIRFCEISEDKEQTDICLKSLYSLVVRYMGDDRQYKRSFCNKIPLDWKNECELKLVKNESR